MIEIQRAVVAAETHASEVMSQERLRMEKFFVEMSRHSGGIHNSTAAIAGVATATVPAERELDNKSPSITAGQNVMLTELVMNRFYFYYYYFVLRLAGIVGVKQLKLALVAIWPVIVALSASTRIGNTITR